MIKRIINNKIFNGRPTNSIAAAALIISFTGVASRVLGFLRDRILASRFGAGDTLDIYYAAFRIPDLVYNLLIVGALGAAFIPVFSSLVAKKEEKESWELASGVLTLKVLAVLSISLLLVIIAPFLINFIAPGFSDEKTRSTIMFTRIMFLSPFFLGISAVFGGILVSLKNFWVYSLAPIMYNIGIIIGAVFFVNLMGPVGLAWGVVLGAFLHLLIQYPAVKFSGFRYKPIFLKAFKNVNVKKVIHLMIPRTLGLAASQINLLVITIFASTLTSGSLSIFNFANNIQSAPLGVFGISFAIAVFPTLSHSIAKDSKEEFIKNFSQTFRQILFFVVPLSIFIIILRAQIVRVVLGAGKFDWEDTVLTFQTLGILSISLFAQSLIPLLTRSFYALHNTKIPFYTAIISETANIIMVIILIQKYQIIGLAIAFSIASVINMFLLLIILRKKLGKLDDKNIISSIMKILIASIVSGLATQLSKNFVGHFVDLDKFWEVFLQLAASGGMGLMIFIYICYMLRLEEFHYFKKSIIKRLFRIKAKVLEDTGEVGGI